MKRIKVVLSLLFHVLLMISIFSCDLHEFPKEEEDSQTAKVLLHLNYDTLLPLHKEVEYISRAVQTEENYDVRYVINVHRSEDEQRFSREPDTCICVTKDEIDQINHTVEIDLGAGFYKFMIWTDYVDEGSQRGKHYNTDSFEEIVLQEDYRGNTDFRDAFCGESEMLAVKAGDMREVTVYMERPLAKYRFVTTDLNDFVLRIMQPVMQKVGNTVEVEDEALLRTVNLNDFRVVFYYTVFLPISFNMFTDKPADAITGVHFDGTLTRLNDTEAELGFDYVFVNGSESSVPVQIEVYDKDGTLISRSSSIDVPIVRSKQTIVRGKFLTTQASSDIGINPGFDGEWDYEIK